MFFLAWFLVPLGISDVGLFPDLAPKVEIRITDERASGRVSFDPHHALLLLWIDDRAEKAYPAKPDGQPARAEDHAELGTLPRVAPPAIRDADQDGIPDGLDLVIGARKVALNAAAYTEGYVELTYPGGDLPRDRGVCTDTLIRAFRNAGIDLQRSVAEDIRRARRAYPMVKKPNTSIDHRRVKTLLPFFLRHFPQVAATSPYRAGEVLFFDTFSDRPGPDHVGIVSDRLGPRGMPLVINNWAPGYRDGDMDLLPEVPVLYRFRVASLKK